MKRCLIVFAKEPVRGKVKTRLNGYLSGEECLNLYKAFLKDTIELAKKIKCENKILAYDSSKSPELLKEFSGKFSLYKQKGRNLGHRMHNAFEYATKRKADKIIIIGSDTPTLPVSFIERAFEHLDRFDVVLGPSRDGGYYLIGLKKPCLGIFRGIKWSTESVLKNTTRNIQNLKKNIVLLEEWYDVDERRSLMRLKQDLKKEKDKSVAQWTRRFLKI